MNVWTYLPLFFGPIFGVVVMIVVSVILPRDRSKARRAAAEQPHPGE